MPVEAQACGCPSSLLVGVCNRNSAAHGSAPEPTGVWFAEQTTDSVTDAIEPASNARWEFSPQAAGAGASQESRFEEELFSSGDDFASNHNEEKTARRRETLSPRSQGAEGTAVVAAKCGESWPVWLLHLTASGVNIKRGITFVARLVFASFFSVWTPPLCQQSLCRADELFAFWR